MELGSRCRQSCNNSEEEDCDAGVSWWNRATGGRQPATVLPGLPRGDSTSPAPVADQPSLCPNVPQLNGSLSPAPPPAVEDIYQPPRHTPTTISSYSPSPVWDVPLFPGSFSGAADAKKITTILTQNEFLGLPGETEGRV